MGSLVSLVMSDIVDSTRRWNAAEGAMAADLELHDRLIREVVEGAGGSVFKHTGDGMIAVFDDPVAAAGAAAGIQQAIGGAQWQHPDGLRVRAAVHTGVVYPRDGDLFGTAVNKVARLLGVCPPGAVLVTSVVAGLLADRGPEGLGLRAVGEVALAGFTTPELVHAISGAGVGPVGSLPAGTGLPRRGGQLPPVDDELVGRVVELAAIWEALGRARLVTLVGVGGMGKTRLALEVAAGGVDAFPGGVWWIDLASATTSETVLPVAMAAVGAREVPGRTPLESFCDRFTGSNALIVIDNCEHVLSTAAELVRALRVAAPEVRLVATSREALGVRGEHLLPVGSLPGDDGVTLFIERALAVQPDLDVGADRAVIERLCARLDGIPLAIELAAARCRSMLPIEIDARLGDRFRLLRGGRSGTERHRTLQAAVAWSYELLDDDERHVFHCLSVFAGGTLIDGLAAVCELDELDVLDIVDRLISRSMVVTTRTRNGTRYHQLETLRQFAEERLVDSGRIGATRDRHVEWVHRLAESIGFSDGTPRANLEFLRFRAEVDNLRAAVLHAIGDGRREVAFQIVAAVATAAVARPEFDLFDLVRPIPPDGGWADDDWTDAAAVCAAYGAAADHYRGRHLEHVRPIGGVPERIAASNLRVQFLQIVLLREKGLPRRELLALLEQIPPYDEIRYMIDREWCVSAFFAAVRGELSDDDADEVRRRSPGALARARASGDDLRHSLMAVCLAFGLAYIDPAEAVRLSDLGYELADQLGADTYRGFATATRLFALSQRHLDSAGDLRTALISTWAAIAGALESGQLLVAGLLCLSAAPTVAGTDPQAARVVIVVFARLLSNDATAWLGSAGLALPDPDTDPEGSTELDRLADEMSLADAVRGVLAALDRVIAAGGDG